MKRIFKNAIVDKTLTDIITEDGVIRAVERCDLPGEDLGGAQVFPGLVDIHTHGCAGQDCMTGDIAAIAQFEQAHGITAFCPTTMTAPFSALRKATASLPQVNGGADILGFHLEGPFLSEKYAGAQDPQELMPPDLQAFGELPYVRMVTLAPELEGALPFIRGCGCPAFLGHTGCDYQTAMAAFDAGAVGLTHTFNAMSPLHHREPGPIGAAFDKGAYVQVIGDGQHLHPAVVRMLYRMFGPERMVLISDSMPATGVSDGDYLFGGLPVHVCGGVARTESGALAGSTSTLYDCVLSVIRMGIPAGDAFRMASRTPSELLGEKRGRIAPGFRADLLVTDEEYRLIRVITA